jgi:hypothetical protein
MTVRSVSLILRTVLPILFFVKQISPKLSSKIPQKIDGEIQIEELLV